MQTHPHKPKGRWTLLFVDEQGKTLSFKRLKGLLIVGAIVLLLCAGAALTMALLYVEARDAKQELAVKLDEAFEAYQRLKDEKDRLVARLVLKESGFLPQQGQAPTAPSAPEKAKLPARQESAAVQLPEKRPGAAKPSAEGPKPPDPAPASSSEGRPDVAGIDFLKAAAAPSQRKIQGQLRVRNQRSRSEPLEGYAFVLFKNQQQSWTAYPAVEVKDGKPAAIQKGHYFKVANYKTLSFTAAVGQESQRFEQAVVYIFSPDGGLLLQKRFPVALIFEGQAAKPPQAAGRTARESLPEPQAEARAQASSQPSGKPEDQAEVSSTSVASSAEARSGWPTEAAFSVHVDSFQERQQALRRLEILGTKKYDCFMVSSYIRGQGLFHRIFVGRFANKTSAATFAAVLRGRKEFDQDIHVVSKSWAVGQQ